MPVAGQSRHFDSAPRTSALLRSADIADRVRQVRFVPKTDIGLSGNPTGSAGYPNNRPLRKWTKPTVANGRREAHAGSDSHASRAPNGWFHTAALRSQLYPGDTGF